MTPAPASTAVRRFVLVALLLPIVLTAASLVIQLLALPHVPSTIAIHWGATGEPDGFGPAWTQPLLSVVVGLGVPLLLALTSLPGLRRGDRGPSYRLLGAVAAAVSALAAVLFSWTLMTQMGLDDARDAESVLPAMLVSFAAALVIGIVAWMLQPNESAHNVTTLPAGGLALSEGERVAWFGTAVMGRAAAITIGVTCAILAAAAMLVWFAGAPIAVALLLGAVTLLLVVLAATTTSFRVRVDAAGLSVVSIVGFPVFTVALSDIRSVAVSDVSPMGEFGGYGIRSVVGGFGIVLRRGPAIDVTKTSGRRFVVTTDDAARGAAVLEALVARAAATKS